MRGGLERWKRGEASHGVRQAIAYAFEGTCDATTSAGVASAVEYADSVVRFTWHRDAVTEDRLDSTALAVWVDGRDPLTGDQRGKVLSSPDADLILDGTINAPKSFSIAALLHPDISDAFEALQDRLRDRVIRAWGAELNARRGAGGLVRESLAQIEVVELKHRRSRALDPHVHRHLWLCVKALGDDGKWSNVDSRVAMRFHTVVNGEGEIAARTDPEWIAALARHGYRIGGDGEILELAHLVKPMSRRSNQIEANRAMLVAEWRAEHPGHEPSPDEARAIDRRAWALGRPNKPHALDENDWERATREELTALDPAIPRRPQPVAPRIEAAAPDVELLALRAIVDADDRSSGYGGRFSVFDIRAGALRAVASSGAVAHRDALQALVEEVTGRALQELVDLVPADPDRPSHVKTLMARETVRLKEEITTRLEQFASPGARPSVDLVEALSRRVLGEELSLAGRQVDAAAALIGADRLVSITGPAGSGKTSMLRVAKEGLAVQGRRMVIVAPTRKAANVAARETGAATSSLHALLHDHGWRWATDATGSQTWSRLTAGDIDPANGAVFTGARHYPLRPGDRIVVDEAGMIDLASAAALFTLARETQTGLAVVGDPLQASPVGHSGAMAAATRHADAVVELDIIHRFHDPAYAALTLRLRNPLTRDDALAVAADLDEKGHVQRVDSRESARAALVNGYLTETSSGRRVAIVTGSNEEADAVNDAIQQTRIDRGELALTAVALGAGQQRILVGDTVQTRRNDHAAAVDNRATWTVAAITNRGIALASAADPFDTRAITHNYAHEHLRLAYASTVHGIQGDTTDVSFVGPDVNAAGLYVGMTRGRHHNHAIVIASHAQTARAHLADTMRRGLPEVDLADASRAAHADLRHAARTIPQSPNLAPPDTDQWIADAERALLRLDAEAATHHARRQTQPPTIGKRAALLRRAVAERVRRAEPAPSQSGSTAPVASTARTDIGLP